MFEKFGLEKIVKKKFYSWQLYVVIITFLI
jgi:hypothetical protein